MKCKGTIRNLAQFIRARQRARSVCNSRRAFRKKWQTMKQSEQNAFLEAVITLWRETGWIGSGECSVEANVTEKTASTGRG